MHILYTVVPVTAALSAAADTTLAAGGANTLQVLNELGRTWEAVQAATRAAQIEPHSADAHITLARAQANLGEPALAVASYRYGGDGRGFERGEGGHRCVLLRFGAHKQLLHHCAVLLVSRAPALIGRRLMSRRLLCEPFDCAALACRAALKLSPGRQEVRLEMDQAMALAAAAAAEAVHAATASGARSVRVRVVEPGSEGPGEPSGSGGDAAGAGPGDGDACSKGDADAGGGSGGGGSGGSDGGGNGGSGGDNGGCGSGGGAPKGAAGGMPSSQEPAGAEAAEEVEGL